MLEIEIAHGRPRATSPNRRPAADPAYLSMLGLPSGLRQPPDRDVPGAVPGVRHGHPLLLRLTKMSLPKTLRLYVTQDDIDNGQPMRTLDCPVALALRRRFPGEIVAVDYYAVFVNEGKNQGKRVRARYQLSKRAAEFVEAFDNALPVQPTSFLLRLLS